MQILKKVIMSVSLLTLITISFSLTAFADGDEVIPASTDNKITSKSAILMEASTGQVLFEQQAQQPLPIGTLNKIMTVLLVAEAVDSGKLALTDQVTTSAYANSMKQAVIWLNVGEKMSVDDLLKGVIVGNANDASVALAETVAGSEEAFVAKMNARAKELGMSNTSFANCTGYDVEGQGSTAYDVALMSRELIKHDWLKPYMTCWMDSLRGGATSIVNTNVLVKSYKGISGIKAGYSDAAQNCLSVAATRDNVTYIAVILGSADKDIRFTEAKNLLNTGFSNYQVRSPDVPSEVLNPIKVTGGTAREVGVKVENLANIIIPNGTSKDLRNEVTLPKEIKAPIKNNQVIGEISFYRGDNLIYKSNLLAINEVDKMTMFKAFGILSQNMLQY